MNPRILALAFGIAVGYVIGARAGRERYEELKSAATRFWEDPRIVKARGEVEDYVKEQAPIVRDRAEAIAKAAPGVVADGARTVVEVAKDAAGTTADIAKDVAAKASTLAKDVADRTSEAAKNVAERSTEVAKDVTDRAKKVASDVRDRGEAVVDRAVIAAGQARDGALASVEDPDDEPRG